MIIYLISVDFEIAYYEFLDRIEYKEIKADYHEAYEKIKCFMLIKYNHLMSAFGYDIFNVST